MRKNAIFLVFSILLLSSISAEIIITQQPERLYNLGDVMNLPVKIVASENLKTSVKMHLLCNGIETEVYKSDLKLATGEEQSINSVIILEETRIGQSTGICKIKATLGGEYALTKEFIISNQINIELSNQQEEVIPGKDVIIEGEARKENGELVKGFIEVKIISDNSSSIDSINTVNNGYFYINISLPEDTKAGQYTIEIEVYEKEDSTIDDTKSNQGFIDYNILVVQIPTDFEIVFENKEVEPGTNLKVKTILHDQTGEKIESDSIITIKNNKNEIIKQIEKPTDEFFEFPIGYNEAPSEWNIFAISNKLTAKAEFNIKEKQDVEIVLINRTVIITNKGNVPYNKTVIIKVGEKTLDIDVNLKVDESQKYILTAPDGEYDIEILSEGKSKMNGRTILTGRVIDVKEASGGIISMVKLPLVWIFIIAILGFVAFMIIRKGYKRSFIGRVNIQKQEKKQSKITAKNSFFDAKDKAELSLSIKGDKQNISLVCLKIKNFNEISANKSNVQETLQRIKSIAQENKAIVYENQDSLFFMLVPERTKTFQDGKTILIIAEKIRDALINHNKLFKQKINFGISLNFGTIVSKQESDSLKFMSMGTLITESKKIATISQGGDLLLNEKAREKLMGDIKTEKQDSKGKDIYVIKEIKRDKEENKKFLKSFMNRNEEKK